MARERNPLRHTALLIPGTVAVLLVGPAIATGGRCLIQASADSASGVHLPFRLWWHSGLIALVAVAVAVALGTTLAAWAAQLRRGPWKAMAVLAGAFPLAAPMYLHGMASWQMAVLLSIYRERLQEGPWVDLLVVGLVQGVRLAALVFLITLAGWHTLDARWLEAGLLSGTRRWVRRRLLVPLLAPFVAFAALLVAVTSLTDVSIPLLFQVHSTLALRLWDAHYRQFDPPATWRAMVPPTLLLVGLVIVLLPVLWRRVAPLVTARRDPANIPHPRGARMGLAAAGTAVLVVMNGSLIHLLRQIVDWRLVVDTYQANGREIVATIETALGAAAVALAAGLALAPWLALGRARPLVLLGGTMALFAVPGFLWSSASVAFWAQPGVRGTIYDTGAIRWLALGGRLVVIPVLALGLGLARIGTAQREAASLAPLSTVQTWRAVLWPQLRRAAWIAYALAALAVMGDLDSAILLDLPGRTTLVVGLCNRLHISPRSPDVAVMALVILTAAAALLATPAVASQVWRRLRRVP